jgi:hypothetical protein
MEKILSECATPTAFLSGSAVVGSRPPMTTSASASSSAAVRPRPWSGSSPSKLLRKARLSPGSCARSLSALGLEQYRRYSALFTQAVRDLSKTAGSPLQDAASVAGLLISKEAKSSTSRRRKLRLPCQPMASFSSVGWLVI